MLIPALTSRPPCSILTRNLLALPVRLGGLGLVNPSTTSDLNFQASEKRTAPLVAIISSQYQTQGVDDAEISTVKKDLKASNRQRSEEEANIIYNQLSLQMKRQVDLAKERGASSWLCAASLRPGLPPTQGRVQGCPMPTLRMDSSEHTKPLQLWQSFFRGSCHGLPHGWLPYNPPQRDQGYNSLPTHRGMPQCGN